MASRRVLVVDGDWKIRRLIRTNLEARGLEVAESGDGGAGLRALADGAYDLVLLSAELPDANGWNIVGQLRRALGPATPIIVIVAEPVDHRLLRRFQRVHQLLKPFSALSLLRSVDGALGLGGDAASPVG